MEIDTSSLDTAFADRLLLHFDNTRRDMPWRRTSDPYAIWISEIMLQQTRVDVVVPYYERWIERFPTIATLADAGTEDVLRAWEGLGYYSRARNLHAAARVLREQHAGRMPDTADALRALPGVGAYTAGAVSSIAYGRAEPAVDGNARRVFARLLDLERDSIPVIHRIARTIMPAARPGDFNQAIMELGATICTPRPHCSTCPVQSCCRAFANGTVGIRPATVPRRRAPAFDYAVAVVIDAVGRVLLSQRPERGLLAGLWQFPAATSPARSVARAARALNNDLTGIADARPRKLAPVTHAFSHRTETYHPYVFTHSAPLELQSTVHRARWVTRAQLLELPMSAAQRRISHAAGLQDPR